MKYALITSALALASTVVAQIPPSYQSSNNNGAGNVEASPVGGNKPAHNGGNANVNSVGNSKPVEQTPYEDSQQQVPQENTPGETEASPVAGRPVNNRPNPVGTFLNDNPLRPIVEGFGIKPVPIGSGFQQRGVQTNPQGNTVASPVGAQAGNAAQGLVSNCLSQQEAAKFVERFSGVLDQSGSDLGDANVTARAVVTEDFVEYSNSILSVQGLPTGNGVAAKDKATWVNGITHAPPSRGIVTLNVDVSCDIINWHWQFNQIGSGQYPVKGFNRFEMTRSEQDAEMLQARRMNLEFDSIAWGLNGQIQSCTFPDGRMIGGSSTGSASASRQS